MSSVFGNFQPKQITDIKCEDIKCDLKDDYPCNLKEYFALIDLIVPPSLLYQNLEKYYNNPNVIVLIIEKMSIGIIFSLHIAEKFSYIANALKFNDFSYIYENGMKIVTISKEWDTKKWSYSKMLNFYKNLDKIENKNCQQLKIKMDKAIEIGCQPDFDIEFLNSLLWNAHLELD